MSRNPPSVSIAGAYREEILSQARLLRLIRHGSRVEVKSTAAWIQPAQPSLARRLNHKQLLPSLQSISEGWQLDQCWPVSVRGLHNVERQKESCCAA
ncbi:unnamed protein product [Protopolystoma xenopodis]|uniref:Uncharacterized protein n=1 Tax=Protopolystoma xenopodis TaxID=117903 RepID=A0A448XK99_9PLAT|nr:unnamed protein product [Protopolystoma xenopodis]